LEPSLQPEMKGIFGLSACFDFNSDFMSNVLEAVYLIRKSFYFLSFFFIIIIIFFHWYYAPWWDLTSLWSFFLSDVA
jgi:preprotein translocase subunit SecG